MEFSAVYRSIKKEEEFLRVTKKNNVEIPRVLVFGFGISKVSYTSLWNFQGWSLVLSGISRGKVKKKKRTISGGGGS